MAICSVIIKTHNSEPFIHKAIQSLQRQTRLPDQVIIVDSASKSPSYLDPYKYLPLYDVLVYQEDLGFCLGNNIGYEKVLPHADFVLFLNPDAFLFPNFIENALKMMQKEHNRNIGVLTGALLGYDIHQDKPTGKWDSTGIFQTWFGKWYDRGQGKEIQLYPFDKEEKVPAICGALMFCRKQALDTVLIRGKEVFDNTFFMYKEDIDLSLRLRKAGWDLLFFPSLKAYHCRGWNSNRVQVPKKLRLQSAKNEYALYLRQKSPYSLYSFTKYCAVKYFNL